METKWTPGPWPVKPTGDFKRIVIGDGLVEGPGGYEVAEVYSDDCDRDEAMANAHLIAAAPDLYAALAMAQLWLDVDGRFDMRGINAALAKARGEA
mgnify:FL=1